MFPSQEDAYKAQDPFFNFCSQTVNFA